MPLQTTGHKRCYKCGERKPIASFGIQAAKYRASYCKPCAAAYQMERRRLRPEIDREAAEWRRADKARNPEKYRRKERDRYERSAAVQLFAVARNKPCVDCGLQLPYQVMELDHVRGTKRFSIGGPKLRRRKEDEVRAEIAKCEVRCPNCHKMRHYHERQAKKAA